VAEATAAPAEMVNEEKYSVPLTAVKLASSRERGVPPPQLTSTLPPEGAMASESLTTTCTTEFSITTTDSWNDLEASTMRTVPSAPPSVTATLSDAEAAVPLDE